MVRQDYTVVNRYRPRRRHSYGDTIHRPYPYGRYGQVGTFNPLFGDLPDYFRIYHIFSFVFQGKKPLPLGNQSNRKSIMITYIRGEFKDLQPARIVVEAAGIGYEVNISLNTYSALSGQSQGLIYVHEVIREDAHLLYGFAQEGERHLFLLLISVSGVGPNMARMILSSLSPEELVHVIGVQDERALKAVKGIGLKTAQRILVDLKDKVQTLGQGSLSAIDRQIVGGVGQAAEEAISALVMLGFQTAAARKVIGELVKESPAMSVEKMIKDALRRL
jgi:Holliday junction DNA helicase RuvA